MAKARVEIRESHTGLAATRDVSIGDVRAAIADGKFQTFTLAACAIAAKENSVELVEANGFSATLNMRTNGNRQTIAIRSMNTDLRGVDITLTR